MSGPPRFWRPTFHFEVRTTAQVRGNIPRFDHFATYLGHADQAVLKYWQLKASADDSGDNLLPIAYLGATQSTSVSHKKPTGPAKKAACAEMPRLEAAFQY